MAKHSSIEWTDHTFNSWYGCTKVSPGCAHCYAEAMMDHRYHRVQWGKGRPRQRTSAAYWKEPVKWNREWAHRAEVEEMRRLRVFCASLADWLDEEAPIEWLADLLRLIFETPHLDWLLLTKRPGNFFRRVNAAACYFGNVEREDVAPKIAHDLLHWIRGIQIPTNIWIGTTVEDQTRADQRIPELLKIPARVRFLSCEPLLGPVKIWMIHPEYDNEIHWVIAGGESGAEARPMHPDWARSLRDQCAAADVPFFFKQWGEWALNGPANGAGAVSQEPGFGGSWDGSTFDPDHYCVGRQNMKRIGKKAAGRLLDGVEHNAFPCSAEAAQDQPEVVVNV